MFSWVHTVHRISSVCCFAAADFYYKGKWNVESVKVPKLANTVIMVPVKSAQVVEAFLCVLCKPNSTHYSITMPKRNVPSIQKIDEVAKNADLKSAYKLV